MTWDVQPRLFDSPKVTLCGYCGTGLVPVEDARGKHFQCPRCAPLLAEVSTVDDWRRFCRETGRRR